MRIPARWNGPPESANGGITCGLLAAHVDAPVVQVTLRRPPPLETELEVVDGRLLHGQDLVAEAQAASVDLEVPASVGIERAAQAESSYEGLSAHPFPTCFVCGPDNPEGLRLSPGRVGPDLVATTWTPAEASELMVWAALDCPGGWSADIVGRPMVLGRMACRVDELPAEGVAYVVQGWLIGSEGRKVRTGSALHDADGRVLAVAEATWIVLAG